MWEIENHFKVKIGGNTFIDIGTIVEADGESLFTLKRDENGYLGIYFEIHDKDGNHIASVKRNEIYYGDKDKYQIDGSLNRYTFFERASGKVLCDIRKREDAHPAELEVSVDLYTPTGFHFTATPEQMNFKGFTMIGSTFMGLHAAIRISGDSIGVGFG